MVLTREALLALDADQITELLYCVDANENDIIISLLAGYMESAEIDADHIPEHMRDAFIV